MEDVLKNFTAVLKNLFQVRRDEKFVNKRAAGHGIFDAIADNRTVFVWRKVVFVHPKRIRSFGLAVDKTVRRLPDRDLALPAQRNAAQPQPVIEQRSFLNLDIGRRQYCKTEPRRREPLEISRVGKKFENPVERLGQPLFGLEMMRFHFELIRVVFADSDVITQHELFRARREVHLSSEIVDIVFLDVMVNQCDRHHERHELAAEVADQFHQLAALGGR